LTVHAAFLSSRPGLKEATPWSSTETIAPVFGFRARFLPLGADLESPEPAELDGLPGEYGAFYFVEERVDEAVDFLAVHRPAGMESFDELGLRDFTSHGPLPRAPI